MQMTMAAPKFLNVSVEQIVADLTARGDVTADTARQYAELSRYDGSRERWTADASLRAEFGSFEAYAAYSKAIRSGQPPVAAQKP